MKNKLLSIISAFLFVISIYILGLTYGNTDTYHAAWDTPGYTQFGPAGYDTVLAFRVRTSVSNTNSSTATVTAYLDMMNRWRFEEVKNKLYITWEGSAQTLLGEDYGLSSTTSKTVTFGGFTTTYSRGSSDYTRSVNFYMGPFYENSEKPTFYASISGSFTIPKGIITKKIYISNQNADGSWGTPWHWQTASGVYGAPYDYWGYGSASGPDNIIYNPVHATGTITDSSDVIVYAYRQTRTKRIYIREEQADGSWGAARHWTTVSGLHESYYSVWAYGTASGPSGADYQNTQAAGQFLDNNDVTIYVYRRTYTQVNNFYYWHPNNNSWYHFASRSEVLRYGQYYTSTRSGMSASPPAGYYWSYFNSDGWTVTGNKNDVDGNGHYYPITYYVSYNVNKPSNALGAVSGSMSTSQYTYNLTGSLAANAFSLTGYDWVGWNTQANGTGTSYANGASVLNWTTTANATIPLYAQWKAHSYSVQYIANKPSIATSDVKGTVANTTHTYDIHYAITQGENRGDTAGGDVKYDNGGICNATRDNAYTLQGWTFVGWSRTADGSSGIETEIYNYTATQGATVKLYAQWRPNTYTVVYDKNKPSNASSEVVGTTANTTHKYDHQYNIDGSGDGIGNVYQATCSVSGTNSANILRYNGYSLRGWTFKGWSTTKDGSSGILTNIKNLTATEKGTVTLYAQWEPIKFKVVYHMNIPDNADVSVNSNGLSLHTVAPSAYALNSGSTFFSCYSRVKGGARSTVTTGDLYSHDSNKSNYCYIGTKTYTYDSTDWALEDLQITVNDAYFIGWTYYDIVWSGTFPNGDANGWYFNSDVTQGDASHLTIDANGNVTSTTRTGSIIGGSIDATYDTTKDMSFKTLSMTKNPFYNVNQTSTENGEIYLVLKANWSTEVDANITYHSNNGSTEATYKHDLGNVNLSSYTDLKAISDSALSNDLFGKAYDAFATFGASGNVGLLNASDISGVTDNSFLAGKSALGDDNSYDGTTTSDQFVVSKDANSKYYFGTADGRTGFFSFQGWSVWKHASWRDSIVSNKQDTGTSWSLANSYQPNGKDGASSRTLVTSGTNGLAVTKFDGSTRLKRIGDLFYRYGVTTISSDKSLNGAASNANAGTNYLSEHTNAKATLLYDAFKWRVTQGASGKYSQFAQLIKNPSLHLYAVWDSYVTTDISNVYVYTEDDSDDDIAALTPKYLFSKVVAYDYEDFEAFGTDAAARHIGDDRTWSSTCAPNTDMASKTAGDKTYTYTLPDSQYGYVGGTFTATLMNYNYDLFKEAKTSLLSSDESSTKNEIQSVALTWKFEDSAGNITYKTSWVYLIDRTNDGAMMESGVSDDTRHSITRFIDPNSFFGDGTNVFDTTAGIAVNNSVEDGGLADRSKWKINPSYTNLLNDSLESLNLLGDSALTIDTSNLFDLKVIYSGDYHPENQNGTWVYDWEAIKSQTEGIYQFDYNDILNSKQYEGRANYESTDYSALQQYIDEILSDTAVEDHRVAN